MPRRGNIYQKVIAAAQQALDRDGLVPTSATELAKLAGVQPREVEEQFGSHQELRDGLIFQAVTLLSDAVMRGAIEAPNDPVSQLRGLASHYVDWAKENPALFGLLVDALASPVRPDTPLARYSLSMKDLFSRKFREMQQLGYIAADRDLELSLLMLHCMMKGASIMIVRRRVDPWMGADDRPMPDLLLQIFNRFLDDLLAQAERSAQI